tara:strand:+ start:1134 stop:1499 length:366 start_codon:yes stop_codon:yes gene_type:complete
MNTSDWGPPTWTLFHTIAFNQGFDKKIPPKKKKELSQFFNSLQYVLPCKYCRETYSYYLTIMPVENYLSSGKDIVNWTFDVHNMVNVKIGKPVSDYKEFVKKYSSIIVNKDKQKACHNQCL